MTLHESLETIERYPAPKLAPVTSSHEKRATTSGAWQRRVAAPPRHRAAAPSRLLAVALPTARRATARVAARAVAARNCNRLPTPTPRRRATRPRPRVRPRPWPPLPSACVGASGERPSAAARGVDGARGGGRAYLRGHSGWGWRSARPRLPDSEFAVPSATALVITIWKIEVKQESSRQSQLPQEMFSDEWTFRARKG